MALSSSIVWEVRTGGSANNGGGFKTGASGTDFSLQDAAQYALTTATTVFATDPNVILHASAAADMVGNIAHIVSSGGGFTAGFYEITSVSVGVSFTVTGAANASTSNGILGVINIGGALDKIGTISLIALAGNKIYIKSGSYTLASDTFNSFGTATLPIQITGYSSTRSGHGDSAFGARNSIGALVTTNMPILDYGTGGLIFNAGDAYCILENVVITSSINSGILRAGGAEVTFVNCSVTNISTGNAAKAIMLENSRSYMVNCDAFLTATTGNTGAAAIDLSGSIGGLVYGCRASTKAAGANGVILGNYGIINKCTIFSITNAGAAGILLGATNQTGFIIDNTIVGYIVGIKYLSGMTVITCAMGNMITDCTTYGIDFIASDTAVLTGWNRMRDNGTATNSGAGWFAATNFKPVTTDTGGPETDYVDSAANNYDLKIMGIPSPAVGAGIPEFSSIGAHQLALNAKISHTF